MWNKIHQPALAWVRRALGKATQAVVPPHCLVCGGAGMADAMPMDVCASCKKALPWMQASCTRCALPLAQSADGCGSCRDQSLLFDRAQAVFRYDAPLDQLLLRFKFHQDLASGRVLAELLCVATEQAAWLAGIDVVTAVPLSKARLRQRGYNQALLLANTWAAHHGVTHASQALVRSVERPAQSGLSQTQRRKNVRGVFAVRQPEAFAGKRVLLVDDVMTTGATVNEASKTLLRAGAASVRVLVVARVP